LISELSNGAVTSTGRSATIGILPRLHILNVDYTILSNRELFLQYNVTQLPTIQIYEKQSSDIGPYQKVLDLPCPPHQFHKVRNWIVSYYNKNETKEQPMDDSTSVLDFGHDVIESSVLPILQRTTSFTKNQNTML
jgi:thioredoxin-related protein